MLKARTRPQQDAGKPERRHARPWIACMTAAGWLQPAPPAGSFSRGSDPSANGTEQRSCNPKRPSWKHRACPMQATLCQNFIHVIRRPFFLSRSHVRCPIDQLTNVSHPHSYFGYLLCICRFHTCNTSLTRLTPARNPKPILTRDGLVFQTCQTLSSATISFQV